jgi:hypothetical protein
MSVVFYPPRETADIRRALWFCRPVDSVRFGFFIRIWSKNASTSAGSHSHGYGQPT